MKQQNLIFSGEAAVLLDIASHDIDLSATPNVIELRGRDSPGINPDAPRKRSTAMLSLGRRV
jgi:hypothetical protein